LVVVSPAGVATATYILGRTRQRVTLDDTRRSAWHDLTTVLGAKYAPHVLFALDARDRRFTDLQRAVGATPTTLSRRLRDLSCRGLVSRRVEATSPPETWYALTDAGREVVAALSRIDDRAELVPCGDDTCAHLAPPVASTCCE
jgi:DNA-binding HxlR family transcriptional regulator